MNIYYKLLIAILLGLLGLITWSWPEIYKRFGVFLFISSVASVMQMTHWVRNNFIIQLRIIFLASIGFYAGFTKLIGADVGFSDFGLQLHTFEIGVKMFAATLMALSGIQLMIFNINFEYVNKKNNLIEKISKPECILPYWITLFAMWLVAYFSALSYGPPVWEVVYASDESAGQLLGNLQSMGVILLGLNYWFALKLNRRHLWIFSFASYFYLLVWGILIRGGRLEFLSGLLVLFVAGKIIRGLNRGYELKSYIYLLIAAVFMEYLGYLRFALAGVDVETMLDGIFRMLNEGVFFLGTISGIASSYANVLHMVDNNVIYFQWGLPYLEYILRTPPEFIYENRPKDLSSIFDNYGYVSIGGFFELAECYLNFGLIGVWLIPGLITLGFYKVQECARGGSYLNYVLFLALLSVFMRGAWYQTFAYYKSLVAGFVIYGAMLFLLFLSRNIFRK